MREADLEFEWDESKNKANIKKHKISFEEAKTVFWDSCARLIEDPDHSQGEERYILLGMSVNLRFLIVCHCYRKEDLVIRIISARKANKTEIKLYKEKLP